MKVHAERKKPDVAARPRTAQRSDGQLHAAAARHPELLPAQDIQALQRQVGNAAVASILAPGAETQRAAIERATRGGGVPVDRAIRHTMETRLGQDLSSVRVHTGPAAESSAHALSATAYTVGNDIVLAGRYNPADRSIQRTLAHELTHVVQQRSGPVAGTATGGGVRVSDPADRFEQAAERVAEDVMSGRTAISADLSTASGGGATSTVTSIQRLRDGEDGARHGRTTITPADDATAGDFTGRQYRISGASPRLIEEVQRRKRANGAVHYVAIGKVEKYTTANMPVMRKYRHEVDLASWRPRITHLNGMAVSPESGINSAEDLKSKIDQILNPAGTLVADVDLLYTYSAMKKGGFGGDVVDCIAGKLGTGGESTKRQEEIMLDAVRERRRVTVSAHSRGTIKTDNAVRTVHKKLTQEYGHGPQPAGQSSPFMRAIVDMDIYIQLIYAGNAVQYPSRLLKIQMTSKKLDGVSLAVGSYTGRGAVHLGGANPGTTMRGGKGGHGFTENYSGDVAGWAAADVAATGGRGGYRHGPHH